MRLHLENIEFDPVREGFSVGAELFTSVQDTYFPAENWYDMACADLKAWIPGLISFGKGHTDFCKLYFMDGDYEIQLARRTDGIVMASCLCDRRAVLSQTEIALPEFLHSVISCCSKYDRFLYENGKENLFTPEIRQLKSIL